MFDAFREEADKCGYQASPDQLAWSNAIYIAETDEKARREARPFLETYGKFFKMNPVMMSPPGYSSIESVKRQRAMRGQRPQTPDDLIDLGTVIVGSPNTVREKLAAYQDLAGFGYSLTKTQFGTMPHEMAVVNQAAVAEEVLPYFKDRMPQPVKRAAAE